MTDKASPLVRLRSLKKNVMVHVLSRSIFAHMLGGLHQVFVPDGHHIAALGRTPRDELVWLNTYLTERLRALPLPAAASTPVQPPTNTPCRTTATDPGWEPPATALAERVGDFNQSMDPWERIEAAPQGYTSHLRQSVLPVPEYIQLRPQNTSRVCLHVLVASLLIQCLQLLAKLGERRLR